MAARSMLRRATGKSHIQTLAESDTGLLSGLELSAGGAGSLYADANSTGITVGGGAAWTGGTYGKVGEVETFIGDVEIDGGLTVNGTTTTVDSELVLLNANYQHLNQGYKADAAQSGGLTVVNDPTTTTTAVAGGAFEASGTTGSGDAEVEVTSTAGFAAGDIVVVTDADTPANNGLYEVEALLTTPARLQLSGVANAKTEDFTNADVTTDATVAGDVTKTNVTVLRAGTDGVWETGQGSTVPISYSDLATAAGATLQSAYEAGNTISMSDAEGDFSVTVGSGNPSIILEAADASRFQTTGANLTLQTLTSGTLLIDGVGIVDVNAGANLDIDVTGTFDMLSTGAFSIDGTGASNVTATSGTLTLATLTTGVLTVDGVDGVNIAGNSSEIDVTTTGALDLNSAAGTWDSSAGIALEAATASSFNVTTGALTLSTTTSGDLTLSTTTAGDILVSSAAEIDLTGQLIDVNAAANMDIDVTGTFDMLSTGAFSIDGTGASNVTTATGDMTLAATAGSAVVSGGEAAVDAVQITAGNAAGGVDVNAGTGGVTVDTTGGFSIDGDTASNVTVTTGALTIATVTSGDLTLSTTTAGDILVNGAAEIDLTAAGLIDVNAGANLDIDVTGSFDMLATTTFSIDGTGASNVSATSGVLTVSTLTSGDLALTAADSVVVTGAEAVADAIQLTASDAAGGIDINAGTGGVALDTTGAFSLDAATASNVTVSGASADLTLGARGTTITLNEAGETSLDGGFTATSIIGALNELYDGFVAVGNLESTYTSGEALNLGSAVYISAASTVSKADASADDALSRFVGFAEAAVGGAASVQIRTRGSTTVEVDAATYAAGEEIYLSETAGRVTNVAPSTSGAVVHLVGYAASSVGVKAAGETIVIEQVHGARAVV